MKKLHLFDVPEEEQRSPGGKFISFCRNISVALGGIRNGGTSIGGHPFDLQIRRIPPGASICPFHSHFIQWELFVVRSGAGTLRAGELTFPVSSGEVFVHPPGEPHQLTNTGTIDLEVLIIADNPALDGCHYPDSDKWSLRPPGKFFRLQETDYFDGEELLPAGTNPAPHRPAGAPPAPALTPFTQRKLHPDSLPWVPWTSPKEKFRGTSKELSIALGALRKTPVGLGGHPFDLELSRLTAGESGCPFHSHASQWELFFFLSGKGHVRTSDGSFPVGPGDVVLQAPGDPHQVRASADEDLTFFLIADNPPVDFWYYPDSKKWGLTRPNIYFYPREADYWDGEE